MSFRRILIVHAAYRLAGGEDAMVRSDVAALEAAGYEVFTHIVENSPGPAAALQLAGTLWNPRQNRSVREHARSVNADIIHFHNTWFSLGSSTISAAAEIAPVVMTLHNYRYMCNNGALLRGGVPCELCVGGGTWHGVIHRCYRDSMVQSAVASGAIGLHRRLGTWNRNVDRYIALNSFARGLFLSAGMPADKLMIRANRVKDAGTRKLPPSASRDFLFVGRLSAEKGVLDLLEAWCSSALHGLGFKLLIAGDGPLRSEVQAAVSEGVEVLGAVDPDEARQLMLQSRAILIPSVWYENQPLVALEAMSSGLPIYASNIGALAEMVADSKCGWTPSAASPKAWAEAMLATTDEQLDAAGHNARAFYDANYHVTSAASSLEEVYRSAMIARRAR